MKYAAKAKNFFSKRVLAGWLAGCCRSNSHTLKGQLNFSLIIRFFLICRRVGNVIWVRFKWAAVGLKK